jgi:hypothetical protein
MNKIFFSFLFILAVSCSYSAMAQEYQQRCDATDLKAQVVKQIVKSVDDARGERLVKDSVQMSDGSLSIVEPQRTPEGTLKWVPIVQMRAVFDVYLSEGNKQTIIGEFPVTLDCKVKNGLFTGLEKYEF